MEERCEMLLLVLFSAGLFLIQLIFHELITDDVKIKHEERMIVWL